MNWKRLAAWVVRSFLVLFIAINAYGWLDILVLQREEYQRLVGSESACGISEAYCSWAAFIWRGAPFDALAVLSALVLLWRGLVRREAMLRAIALAICIYLVWTAYDALASYPRQVVADDVAMLLGASAQRAHAACELRGVRHGQCKRFKG